jgi:hypothetical protein
MKKEEEAACVGNIFFPQPAAAAATVFRDPCFNGELAAIGPFAVWESSNSERRTFGVAVTALSRAAAGEIEGKKARALAGPFALPERPDYCCYSLFLSFALFLQHVPGPDELPHLAVAAKPSLRGEL